MNVRDSFGVGFLVGGVLVSGVAAVDLFGPAWTMLVSGLSGSVLGVWLLWRGV